MYRNGEEVAQGFHFEGENSSYINYRDEARARVLDLQDSDDDNLKVEAEAKIYLQTRTLPQPAIETPEFSETEGFDSTTNETSVGSKIWTKIEFKNTGEASLYRTQLSVKTPHLKILEVKDTDSKLDNNNYDIEKGELTIDLDDVKNRLPTTDNRAKGEIAKDETYTLKLQLEVPPSLETGNPEVEAQMSGVDIKETEYTNSTANAITAYSPIRITRSIGPDLDVSTSKPGLYPNKEHQVTLRIKNTAERPILINRLTDNPPTGIEVPKTNPLPGATSKSTETAPSRSSTKSRRPKPAK